MEQENKENQEQLQGGALGSSSQEAQTDNPAKEKVADKPNRELTEEERLKRNKLMVLGAAIIGCVFILGWLFTSLSGSDENVTGRNGFNTEMPDADQGSSNIADKSKAYEMEGVKKNQQGMTWGHTP